MNQPDEREDAATPQGEPPVEIPARDEELLRLKGERDQLETQLQRTLADTVNMRRRQKQEMDDSRNRVLEGLTQELLPVLDSFTMALQAHESGHDPESLVEGVRLVRTLLSGALERHGLQEIQAEGMPFDPARHEAVAVEPTNTVPEGHVVRVLQVGYMLGDRVVRHSKVVVAGSATPNPTKPPKN
ncbi:MAG TPA: nucleotide exchange factor GrpE [Planctomycetota bacterium]|nr:nucleotide exchange factor GrpE [Planctomycetota bacterium]